jgi:hypothetical protein
MGLVYKINYNGYFYYGSTTTTLHNRLINHKTKSKKFPTRKLYNHIQDWNQVSIELIEETNNYLERENHLIQEHINNPFCLNTFRVSTTEDQKIVRNKEYYQLHKDEYRKRDREWCEKNKERRREVQREYRLRKNLSNI